MIRYAHYDHSSFLLMIIQIGLLVFLAVDDFSKSQAALVRFAN